MKVIEIKKHIINGLKIGHVFLDDINDPEEISEHVEYWCYDEPNGHGNGWRSEWREIVNETERNKIILGEVEKMDRNISLLVKKRDSLLDDINLDFIPLK